MLRLNFLQSIGLLALLWSAPLPAQTFHLSVDTLVAYPGDNLSGLVHIVSPDAHFGTFYPGLLGDTSVTVSLEHGGVATFSRAAQGVNDTLLDASISLSPTASTDYDVRIVRHSRGTPYDYLLPNAIHVVVLPPTIAAIKPKSGRRGQTVTMSIYPAGTDLMPDSLVPGNTNVDVTFTRNGGIGWVSHPDDLTAFTITSTFTIPLTVDTGDYAVTVSTGGRKPWSYSASQPFTVLAGPAPSVRLSPDTVLAGAETVVLATVVNDAFRSPSDTVERSVTPDIRKGTTVQGTVTGRTVSSTEAKIPLYFGATHATGEYNLHFLNPEAAASFVIAPPARLTSLAPDHAKQRDTVALSALIRGFHLKQAADGSPIQLLGAKLFNAGSEVFASSFMATSDSTLQATFALPDTLGLGVYELWVQAGVTTVHLPASFRVMYGLEITGLVPDTASPGASIPVSFESLGYHVGDEPAWATLQHGPTTIIAEAHRLPFFGATFNIPVSAPPGRYDLTLIMSDPVDTVYLKNAFTVLGTPDAVDEPTQTETANLAFDDASRQLFVRGTVDAQEVEVRLFDLTGRCVQEVSLGNTSFAVPISGLAAGHYFYTLRCGSRSFFGSLELPSDHR